MKMIAIGTFVFALFAASTTVAIEAPLNLTGETQRVDAVSPCPQEPAFWTGFGDTAANLRAGGVTAGCDSEWGVYSEFALPALSPEAIVTRASFVIHKTGYGEEASGMPYVGVYGYGVTGLPVEILRSNLTPQTALDGAQASYDNVDMLFDVTSLVKQLYSEGATACGIFFCGLYSEVGYDELIYVGGAGSAVPPRLLIESDNAVTADLMTWGSVKVLYR